MNTTSKTLKVGDVVNAYNVLCSLKLTGMDKEVRYAVIRAAKALRGTAQSFEAFVADARERLKPEGWDAAVAAFNADQNDAEAQTLVNALQQQYAADINACVAPEHEREVEISGIPAMSEDLVADISDANPDIDVRTMLLLEDVMTETESEESAE